MLDKALAIIQLIAMLIAIFSILIATFRFLGMAINIKPEKRIQASLLAPIMFLFPRLFTSEGNRYRLSFAPYVLLFLLMFGIISLIEFHFEN